MIDCLCMVPCLMDTGNSWCPCSLRGMVTGVRYMDEILDIYARPYADATGPQLLLMDDNARPHRARMVEEYLQQETIVRMDWPACSPDLHLIVPGWLRSTSNRRPPSVSTGQHARLISTLDLIVPGWLRSTSNRRPSSSVWTGQHARLISTRSSMFGTCYRWRCFDVRSSQQLSWNWEIPSLKCGTIFRWQPFRDSLEA